jgi:two-component system CheB/CheR fusion protein
VKALLDDLLDVSRLKLGRLELHRGPVRLSQVVSNALETTKPLLAEAGHALELRMPQRDVELEGDALRLGQVVSNLLANAIRYTPRGGKITLEAALEGGQLAIVVTDTGVGMEPSRTEQMFDMFTQGEAGERVQGLGIGLALVKNIVELHGGRVTARSEGTGRGSEFRVELPGAKAVAKAPAPTATPAPGPRKKRGTIVIADDNPDAGWGMAKLLELAGFEAVQARSGQEALEAMEQRKPDAAVLDIGMPDLDGHEVARRARRAAWGKRMVLIAATGWGQQADQEQASAAGFDAHLTKPVDARKLVALLDELVAAKRR